MQLSERTVCYRGNDVSAAYENAYYLSTICIESNREIGHAYGDHGGASSVCRAGAKAMSSSRRLAAA